jgi:hypothetical protein
MARPRSKRRLTRTIAPTRRRKYAKITKNGAVGHHLGGVLCERPRGMIFRILRQAQDEENHQADDGEKSLP